MWRSEREKNRAQIRQGAFDWGVEKTKPVVTLYTRHGCHLCETAKEAIIQLQTECNFEYVERDIDDNDDWTEKYGLMIPVVEINGEEVQYGHIDKKFLFQTLTKK